MTIQSDILFIPEDFSTSQLNKRTEYLVEYLKECSLIARELSIEFDREFPNAQISLKRSAQQLRWQWRGGSRRCFDPAAILAQDHAEHKEKIVSIETDEPKSTMRCQPRQRSYSGCANTAALRTISSQRPENLPLRDLILHRYSNQPQVQQ